MTIAHYVALGDSMSSDHYPTCDARGLDLPPPVLDPLGAAALLHERLRAVSPGSSFRNLTEDGAMIDDVVTEELARLGHDSSEPGIVVTLTAGGNDLLDAVAAGRRLDAAVDRIQRRYGELVATLREELPQATLVLTTVYDPTDGTGRLPGFEMLGPLPLQYLSLFNAYVGEAARRSGAVVADVHRHFLGHGVSAPSPERWYWGRNMIEPNARGAAEIRNVWWAALESLGAV
ncbi:MAG TPA: GDSL-type esterase/lipase family protein [Gemmatimonadales bacterium]|nr:GDSL-type esterase/lipase family protein [Gemmatimonadales bacterium]